MNSCSIYYTYTTRLPFHLDYYSYRIICGAVRGWSSPSRRVVISACTSPTERTTLAFSRSTSHSHPASTELRHSVLPAPGEPVTIRKRYPFFRPYRHSDKKALIRSISLYLNLNFEGMLVPLRNYRASARRNLKLRREGPRASSTSSVQRL